MKRLIRFALALAFIGGIFMATTWLVLLFRGPHMTVQPHIRAYERPMPLPPEGIVAVQPVENAPPSREKAANMRNPVSDTPDNRKRGKTYYEYYCIFCHGLYGNGDGPVGNSYMPVPTSLRDLKVVKMSDGELFRAMLTGVGHDPVLPRVVPAGQRWYLALYVRELGRMTPPEPELRRLEPKGSDYP